MYDENYYKDQQLEESAVALAIEGPDLTDEQGDEERAYKEERETCYAEMTAYPAEGF